MPAWGKAWTEGTTYLLLDAAVLWWDVEVSWKHVGVLLALALECHFSPIPVGWQVAQEQAPDCGPIPLGNPSPAELPKPLEVHHVLGQELVKLALHVRLGLRPMHPHWVYSSAQ